ncbi:hypothetical protein BC833DRAFT_563921 [Globomyces pollinis-pini]|nr:hypothetical protein BC833DRAFT_563921 [Globomyces pollinis-pini]
MTRERIAYITPACVFIGMAIHEYCAALFILLTVKSRDGALYVVSWITTFILLCFLIIQILTIDYLASPYVSILSVYFLPYLFCLNYIFNLLTTASVVVLMLLRTRIIISNTKPLFKLLCFLAPTAVILKSFGAYLGFKVSYSIIQGEYRTTTEHPSFGYIGAAMAIAGTVEAIYTTMCIVLYLVFLQSLRHSSNDYSKIIRNEGVKLVFIILLQTVMVIFGIWLLWEDTYVNHTAFYMQGLTYSLELFTFLNSSYKSPKKIIQSELNKISTKDDSSVISHNSSEIRQTDNYTPDWDVIKTRSMVLDTAITEDPLQIPDYHIVPDSNEGSVPLDAIYHSHRESASPVNDKRRPVRKVHFDTTKLKRSPTLKRTVL